MKLNNLTPSSFADEIGVQRSSVSHILSGRNKPSMEFIQKVLIRFPKVSADWLIGGAIDSEKVTSNVESINEPSPQNPAPTLLGNGKGVKKIVVFYNDNTFEEFFPNQL